MSNDTISLQVEARTELGKSVKTLRRDGRVPANIYQRGQESMAVSANFTEITKVYSAAGKHHPVEITLDGKKHLAMIKDVDLEPIKGWIRHIAFHAINKNETVTAEIPVHVVGEIPAERVSLMVLHTLDMVEVEAIPSKLPDELTVDGTTLVEIGDKLQVSDIVVPEGVVIKTDPEQTIAVVEEPVDQIAAADAELEENADAADVPSENGTDETAVEEEKEA